MSDGIVKYGETTSEAVGGTLLKVGGGAAALGVTAAVLPVITFPMLIVGAIGVGGYLKIRKLLK